MKAFRVIWLLFFLSVLGHRAATGFALYAFSAPHAEVDVLRAAATRISGKASSSGPTDLLEGARPADLPDRSLSDAELRALIDLVLFHEKLRGAARTCLAEDLILVSALGLRFLVGQLGRLRKADA